LIIKRQAVIIVARKENIMIGERVKKRREDLKMTQLELAERMGYTNKSTIGKIENNVNDIPLSKVEQLAAILMVTPGYLMGWAGEYEQELLDAFYSLNDEGKEKLRDYARDLCLSGSYKKRGSDSVVSA